MNYRLLFIISFLILGIGLGGLFFVQNNNDAPPVQIEVSNTEQYKDVVITVAIAERDISQGEILKAEDYRLTTKTLRVKDNEEANDLPEMILNVQPIIEAGGTGSLLGFLCQENVAKGSYLSQKMLLSPNSEEYISAIIDPNTQVAYVLPVDQTESYLLKTIKTGMNVSLYIKLERDNDDNVKEGLVKILDYIPVLRVNVSQEKDKESSKESTSVGSLVLKLSVAELKQLYNIPRSVYLNHLIALPATEPMPIKSHGLYIYQLRG